MLKKELEKHFAELENQYYSLKNELGECKEKLAKLKNLQKVLNEERMRSKMLNEENRKLWYMVRHLTEDTRLLVKIKEQFGDKETPIDPFFYIPPSIGPNF